MADRRPRNDYPKSIRTPCCFGLQGKFFYGRFRKDFTGGYQGLGEYDHAIVATSRTSVIVSAADTERTSVFEHVLYSIVVH